MENIDLLIIFAAFSLGAIVAYPFGVIVGRRESSPAPDSRPPAPARFAPWPPPGIDPTSCDNAPVDFTKRRSRLHRSQVAQAPIGQIREKGGEILVKLSGRLP